MDPNPDDALERSICREIQGRQRYWSGPRRVRDAINELIARRGYANTLTQADCQAAWVQAVGAGLAQQTQPGNIRRGVLEVFVVNSAVMQDLVFRKREIVRQLAALAPDQKIRDLRFRVGTVER